MNDHELANGHHEKPARALNVRHEDRNFNRWLSRLETGVPLSRDELAAILDRPEHQGPRNEIIWRGLRSSLIDVADRQWLRTLLEARNMASSFAYRQLSALMAYDDPHMPAVTKFSVALEMRADPIALRLIEDAPPDVLNELARMVAASKRPRAARHVLRTAIGKRIRTERA